VQGYPERFFEMIFATSTAGLVVFFVEATLCFAGSLLYYRASIVGRKRLGLLILIIGCITTSITFIALNETDRYIRAIGMSAVAVYALYEMYKLHSLAPQRRRA